MLTVLIITQEEPFYIPKMIEYLIKHDEEKYKIVGVTILKPHRKDKNYLHWFKERASVYTYSELFLSGIGFISSKFASIVNKKSHFQINNIVKEYNIPLIPGEDINSVEYIKQIKLLEVDVIISISCPQLFKEKLLSVPKKYCINAHGTLLPRHRGVFGSWWTLFCGDKFGGSTIHTMELRLDAGKILWQKEFPIEDNDTQYSIAYKTKRDMAEGLVETIKNIAEDKIRFIEPKYEATYHRAPTREQGKEFHKKKLSVIKLSDLKLVLSKSF